MTTSYRPSIVIAAMLSAAGCGIFGNSKLEENIVAADNVSVYDAQDAVEVPDFLGYRETLNLAYLCGMSRKDATPAHRVLKDSLLAKLNGGNVPDSLEDPFYFFDENEGSNTAGWRVMAEDGEAPILEMRVHYKPNKESIYQTPVVKSVDVIQRVFDNGSLAGDQVTRYVPGENGGTEWVTAFEDYAVYNDGNKVAIGNASYVLQEAEVATVNDVVAQMIMRAEGQRLRAEFNKPKPPEVDEPEAQSLDQLPPKAPK